jgi:hypothetical protein
MKTRRKKNTGNIRKLSSENMKGRDDLAELRINLDNNKMDLKEMRCDCII